MKDLGGTTRLDGIAAPCRTAREERRVMCRTLVFWEGLRRDERLPRLDEIAGSADVELSPFLYVVEVRRPLDRARFVRCGSVLAAVCGGDPVGRTLGEALPAAIADTMMAFFNSAIHYRQPLADNGSFMNGGGEVLYRNIVMPLQGGDGEITHLLGGFSYRMVV
jgi:hypothetical protein